MPVQFLGQPFKQSTICDLLMKNAPVLELLLNSHLLGGSSLEGIALVLLTVAFMEAGDWYWYSVFIRDVLIACNLLVEKKGVCIELGMNSFLGILKCS